MLMQADSTLKPVRGNTDATSSIDLDATMPPEVLLTYNSIHTLAKQVEVL